MTTRTRPTLYVPVGVNVATGKTGTAILNKFGPEGLASWVCFLAACKRSRVQGQITYCSEAEGWDLLGLGEHRPSFTLDAFFQFTGRLKQTRRTRSGRTWYVESTRWKDWNDAAKRETARQQKARVRAESNPDTERTAAGHESDTVRLLESESESEKELRPSDRSKGPHRPGLNGHTPVDNPLLERLLAWADRDLDDGGRTIKRLAKDLPEAALARVLKAVQHRRPRDRAAYLAESLKAEQTELTTVREQARTSLHASAEPAYPDEPPVD